MTVDAAPPAPAPATTGFAYPAAPRGDVVETQFGDAIADPYRWLENDVRTDAAVADWVHAQTQLTGAYLAGLPGRDTIRARMKQLWDYERFAVPLKRGGRYFYQRNAGLQNQSPLYVRDTLDAAPRLLIDPNPWAKDGATALAEWAPSDDGRHLAYAVQDGGTDWRTIHVIDVASGHVHPDTVRWAKFSSIAWAKNGSGFFYSRFSQPKGTGEYLTLNLNHAIYFHRLGSDQAADRLVFATPDRPKLNNVAEVTDDGHWLVIYSSEGTDSRFEVSLIDLEARKVTTRTLIRGLENNWQLIGNHGSQFYFVTNLDAPRQRIVAIDVASAGRKMREIVPQDLAKLDGASLVGDRLVATYLVDARSEVRLFTPEGRPAGAVALPGLGTVAGFDGRGGDTETFFSFQSWATPATIYRLDTATGAATVFAKPTLAFDPADYVVEQRFYASKDGTRVPIFLTHRKDIDLATPHPTLLYAYGGFDISVTPGFNAANLTWMEMGGIYAVANIRGGGEYGKAWHDAGRLAHKQNVFDDFIAAAEYLEHEGITTKAQLAIEGRSNGGLLIGAVTNQRPDLFAVALPAVGVMDMLRFNRFTAGRYWVDDYGDPGKEPDFKVLRAYSPYHNIRAGTPYPAVMVTTADTDDRVVPGHSFKYAAALQAAPGTGDKPHLIRIETRAGHGSGKPTDKLIDEFSDLWAFAAKFTGLAVAGTR